MGSFKRSEALVIPSCRIVTDGDEEGLLDRLSTITMTGMKQVGIGQGLQAHRASLRRPTDCSLTGRLPIQAVKTVWYGILNDRVLTLNGSVKG